MNNFSSFHLFAGAGGGSLGFKNAGFHSLGAIDKDPLACEDHGIVTGEPATCADVLKMHARDLRKMTGGETPDVFVCTAPCVGFSGCLPKSMAEQEEYQLLNSLALQGLSIALDAWDRPPPLLLFENVPRITARGREWLDRLKALLQHYGYSVAETVHNCGEIGGLAENRIRFLLVARHMAQVPNFLHVPPKKRVRGVGEVIGDLPIPLPPESAAWLAENGGVMHRLPKLSPLNWLRLWAVTAGLDWKSLPAEVRLPYRKERQNGGLGVVAWNEPSHTVVGAATVKSAWASVADPRLGCKPRNGAYGVVHWNQPSKTVLGHACHDNSPASVADPRVVMGDGREIDLSDERPGHLVLVAPDGTWHRPFTTLELAAIQGFPTKINGEWLRLSGNSHKHWRLVIGNAVPVQAAEAIARACAETLEEARRGGWSLTGRKIWVTPRTGLAA
jgi:site-specific DNA-cytosine methylase